MQRKFISRRSFLKCAGVGAVTAAAAGLLAGCGLPPDVRGERLGIPEFAALARALRQTGTRAG